MTHPRPAADQQDLYARRERLPAGDTPLDDAG